MFIHKVFDVFYKYIFLLFLHKTNLLTKGFSEF